VILLPISNMLLIGTLTLIVLKTLLYVLLDVNTGKLILTLMIKMIYV